MKKLFLMISAVSVLSFGAEAQKKEKISKADKEFLGKQPDGIYAKFETSKGNIYIVLEYKKTPMTVANFVGLAEGKIKNTAKPEGVPYYNGIIFHRVLANFMVQGGCPQGTGMGGPGYTFPDEFDPTLKHSGPGILSMANTGQPVSNGSQFFITHGPTPFLDGKHSVFGHVVEGMDVVNKIQLIDPASPDNKVAPDTLKKLVILRKGKEAEAFDAPKVFEAEKANAPAKAAARAKAAEEEARIKQAAVQAEGEKVLKEKYSAANTTASGLRTMIEKAGEGPAIKTSDNISLHCTGYLLDGTKFWSSYDGAGEPLAVSLGVSPRLIPGMEEGIMLLKQGGKAKLIIPPNIGYGERGQPPVIPPNSWLVFDIEVLKVN